MVENFIAFFYFFLTFIKIVSSVDFSQVATIQTQTAISINYITKCITILTVNFTQILITEKYFDLLMHDGTAQRFLIKTEFYTF